MADDYISREAAMECLYRSINADPEGNCPNCIHDEHDCQYDRCWTLMDFCEKIEYIGYVPAADVAPVRHGRWQITDAYPHNVYCSECHKRFAQTHWAVWEDGSLPRAHCPNCGAKMDGEA